MYRSHGTGQFSPRDLASCGEDCVFEAGALVFHPETVHLGRGVYLGHYAILKGYHQNTMHIGDGTWIGQQCFFHSAGGLRIGAHVGIGPGVQILTSKHQLVDRALPIVRSPLDFAAVVIEDHADIGAGAVVLPGVRIGKGAQIGAGAVVSEDIAPYTVAAGVPARALREWP